MGSACINSFSGKYRWLSNFAFLDKPIQHKGVAYPTVEHFYQAMKFTNQDIRIDIANHDIRGLKWFVRKHEHDIRPDFHDIKLGVMEIALRWKFCCNQHYRTMLINTKDAMLIEGNNWGDVFWGVDSKTGEGFNHLGKLLMKIRDNIKGE